MSQGPRWCPQGWSPDGALQGERLLVTRRLEHINLVGNAGEIWAPSRCEVAPHLYPNASPPRRPLSWEKVLPPVNAQKGRRDAEMLSEALVALLFRVLQEYQPLRGEVCSPGRQTFRERGVDVFPAHPSPRSVRSRGRPWWHFETLPHTAPHTGVAMAWA